MQDHKSPKRPNEKKNEEAIVNMVTTITTSKAPKEVTFHEKESLKGKKTPRLTRRGEIHAINDRNCLGVARRKEKEKIKVLRATTKGNY